jgi:hypothetical protein
MLYTLRFSDKLDYDAGLAGITVPISLELIDRRVNIEAKLDTGASECIMAHQHAMALGIDLEQGWPMSMQTATGRVMTYRHRVTLVVSEYRFDVGICFAADQGLYPSVLGRNGFLDRVNIGLVDYEGKLYLGRYGDDDL